MSGLEFRRKRGPRLALLRGHAHVLPEFFLVGVQKGGTTSLYADLVQHPDVVGVPAKEIFYLDRHYHESESWYRCWFPTARAMARNERATGRPATTGEASASSLDHPAAAQRAAALVPDARIIAMLRDPVERAISHYFHNKRKGREPLSLEAALDAEAERLRGEEERVMREEAYFSRALLHYGYARRGQYAEHLESWIRAFGRERVLVLESEAYFEAPEAVFAEAASFLGLAPWAPPGFVRHNPGTNRKDVAPEVRERLRAHFAPHNARLTALLGRPFRWASGG